jgi:hypothetical protein
MNTYSTSNKPHSIEEAATQFEKQLAKANTVRASALSGLQRLRAARANYVQREQTLVAAKLGEDHPDSVRLKVEVAASQSLDRKLGAEIDRINIPAPVVSERGWMLHGFVRDRTFQGQPNLTVAMFNSTNRWVEALGHACTDKRGYFQLCFAGGTESAVEQWGEIFLRVSDAKRQALYRDKTPTKPVSGGVQYREIILNGDGDCCEPPSDLSSKEPSSTTKQAAPSKSRKTKAAKKAARAKKG